MKIAINGFGRIGRNTFKVLFDKEDVEIVAINDLTDAKTLAHLLKYDSSYGIYNRTIEASGENIIVDGHAIRLYAEPDPSKLPWREHGVDVVIESTGFFTDSDKARAHIDAGAKRVVISAPLKDEGAKTIILGVNDEDITEKDLIISNGSCTTNCIAPIMKILEDNLGVEKAMMSTVHSYTASQRLLDAPAKDLRAARSAAESIIPGTTGASKATTLAISSLKNKFNGLSFRVPTPVVSISDITAIVKRPTTKEELNQLFKDATTNPNYQGIVDVSDQPLVSMDYKGNPYSTIVDLALTDVVAGDMIKVVAWYDNEWGYSNRLAELTYYLGTL